MHTVIRTFTPNDYSAVLDIFNASWQIAPITIEQLRSQDEAAQSLPEYTFQRYIKDLPLKLFPGVLLARAITLLYNHNSYANW